MISTDDFPGLTPDNHRVTSPATAAYNCIAWSAGDTGRWWEPGVYWPVATDPNDYGLGVLAAALRSLGYDDCGDDVSLEPGFEKIVLYGDGAFYTHAARQLPDGKWTSKLGKLEDIEHDTPFDVAGGAYGEVAGVMKRPRPGPVS